MILEQSSAQLRGKWAVSSTVFGDPNNKDYSFLGCTLGFPLFWDITERLVIPLSKVFSMMRILSGRRGANSGFARWGVTRWAILYVFKVKVLQLDHFASHEEVQQQAPNATPARNGLAEAT